MPIHVPGKRNRKNKALTKQRRAVVATLTLTAMVDMFTVLVVFLLQNYKTTGQIIVLNENVELPQASETKELKPATVVMVSPDAILIENQEIISFEVVKQQKSWMINDLYIRVQRLFEEKKREDNRRFKNAINTAVKSVRKNPNLDEQDYRKVTLQADKNIDFLTIKKIMYTLTEAGATEVNFAVIQNTEPEFKKEDEESQNLSL